MRHLFVSDLHLEAERQVLFDLFEHLMDHLAPLADRLYLLGDVFEYWVGDDGADGGAEHVARRLAEFAASGRPVYFMAGNRDFLVGEAYARAAGFKILSDPATVTLPDGRLALLSHGDRFCLDDAEYAAFYRTVRDPAWQRAFLARSLEDRHAYAQQAREASQTHGAMSELGDVAPSAVSDLLSERKIRTLIHGHTHRPAIHVDVSNDAVRVVLPDWRDTGAALWATPAGLTFEEFAGSQAR